MKILILLLLITFSSVGFTDNSSTGGYEQAQESLLMQVLSNQSNKRDFSSNTNGQLKMIGISPILRCDGRTVCTNDFQCGWDGFCGPGFGSQVGPGGGLTPVPRKCICY